MAWKFAFVLAFSALLSGVHSVEVIKQNHKEVTLKEGDEVTLTCTADVEALGCTFRSPGGTSYQMIKDSKYDGGRIQQQTLEPEDCSMVITQIQESDNGQWECTVSGKDSQTGDFAVGTENINVVVAVPPAQVYLQVDGSQVNGPIELNLDEKKQLMVDCVATEARPRAEFKWYIGSTELNANVENREEEGTDGKMTYISTLEYNAAPKHSGQMLKCEVNHMGFTMQAIADESNIAQASLDLKFMPEGKSEVETIYGNKEGESNTIRMKFLANPMPTEGQWSIGEVSVPIGASDVEGNFQSSQIQETGDMTGEYQVELTFTMTKELADKKYSLQVTNGLGTTAYDFKLALDDAPPTESAGGPVIIVVLVVVAIIIVGGVVLVARAKGMMCFADKSEPLDEEKEAFDDAEKGKLAGETEKATKTPDKKPITEQTETKPETDAENKEEKKSNGAHTPV